MSQAWKDENERERDAQRFAARKVPDFARLHAMEEQRVQRWKSKHKRELTIPKDFRGRPMSGVPSNAGSHAGYAPARPTTAHVRSSGQDTGGATGMSSRNNGADHEPASVQGVGVGTRSSTTAGVRVRPASAAPVFARSAVNGPGSSKFVNKLQEAMVVGGGEGGRGGGDGARNAYQDAHSASNQARVGPPKSEFLYPNAVKSAQQQQQQPPPGAKPFSMAGGMPPHGAGERVSPRSAARAQQQNGTGWMRSLTSGASTPLHVSGVLANNTRMPDELQPARVTGLGFASIVGSGSGRGNSRPQSASIQSLRERNTVERPTSASTYMSQIQNARAEAGSSTRKSTLRPSTALLGGVDQREAAQRAHQRPSTAGWARQTEEVGDARSQGHGRQEIGAASERHVWGGEDTSPVKQQQQQQQRPGSAKPRDGHPAKTETASGLQALLQTQMEVAQRQQQQLERDRQAREERLAMQKEQVKEREREIARKEDQRSGSSSGSKPPGGTRIIGRAAPPASENAEHAAVKFPSAAVDANNVATTPNHESIQQRQEGSHRREHPVMATASGGGSVEEGDGSRARVDAGQLRKIIEAIPVSAYKDPQSFSSYDFYTLGKTLGEGAYGKVKLATHVITGEKLACKCFERSKLTESHSRKRVAREIRILKALSHPNIIRLFEVVEHPARKLLMMQYSSGGDLCRYVREHRRLSESEACRLFCQIIEGLRYCHSSGIVHRDVKLDNLLIDENRNIKIVDFGFSVSFKEGQKLRKACGSPSYAAPEIVARRPYAPAGVDVWSSGVVLYAMVCGYFPFQGANNQELCKRIVKGKFDCPSFMSAECRDLVRRMMNVDAVKRITISEIQQHAWCKGWFAKTERHDGNGKQIDCEASMDSLNGSDQIPVDDRVVDSVCQHGYKKEYVGKCVAKNLHNQCTATYWVLQQKRQAALQSAACKD